MKRKNQIVVGIIAAICLIIAGSVWIIEANSSKTEAGNKDKSSMNSKQMLQSQHSNHNAEKTQEKTVAVDRTKSSAKSELDKEGKVELNKKSQSNTVNSQPEEKTSDISDNNSSKSTARSVSITGYITSEDDFAAGLKEDTANMVYMRLMALSGLGITFQQNGSWVFYYFDGNIASDNKSGKDGKWTFNGSGSQLTAWNIVQKHVKEGKGKYPVQVTVKGVLKGNTGTNPGPDADGKKFPVITVESIN
ncbi:MAG: hypothetical protein LKE46_05445 [Clostridium sp.]|jgi:glucan-binding YG repeat protein|uniref:hypothetical protein n=1 Tax=Clostridium sp. TaxID=1506 RepID=UPI0025C5F5B2|nr:hypothetical protein [Clostridium sp.]MCH3963697.1 hypothetical protein [Clostridium sp.]MCI1714838.1 hypothetical protein [Clostridium sp.]MCI1798973.1 hypothetical protein [Clostridium sp.]MCI1813021.1 hypothetical protein [Clostridium sp.]MCI1869911.1 hypothetical protein [Clostridium sp.]